MPPTSLAQRFQVLAWVDLECTPCPTHPLGARFPMLAKLDREETRAKHPMILDSLDANRLELA